MLLAVGFACLATLLTYTRAAWITVVGRLFFLATASPRMRKAILVPLFVLAIGIFIFRSAIVSSKIYERRIGNVNTITARMVAQKDMINMIKQRPWFGYGTARYMNYLHLYHERTLGIRLSKVGGGPSHNTYLSIIAEIGIIGFLPYLIIFIVMGYRAIIAYKLLPDSTSIICKDLVSVATVNVIGYFLIAISQDNRCEMVVEYSLWVNMAILWICHRRAMELAAKTQKVHDESVVRLQEKAAAHPTAA